MTFDYMTHQHTPITQTSSHLDLYETCLDKPYDKASWELLSQDEKNRACRFHFKKHQQHFVNARVFLRKQLALYLAIEPASIVFDYHPHGKPYIADAPWLQFNLSHAQSIALLAIGITHPLGIDLEFFSPRPFLGIATHVFSEQEVAWLKTIPKTLLPLSFFHLWAQKEAVIKAVGRGLAYPTDRIQVPYLPPTRSYLTITEDHTPWHIHSFFPRPGCCAALCCHPSVTEIRRRLPVEQHQPTDSSHQD